MPGLKHNLKFMAAAIFAAAIGFCLQSCFTGIEHTGHIKLSKEDRQTAQRISQDEAFMSEIHGVTADLWKPSRMFVPVGERSSWVFDNPKENPAGKHLAFVKAEEFVTPGGTSRILLVFNDSVGNVYRYPSTRTKLSSICSTELPMLLDYTLVSQLDSLMRGRELWIKTSDWLTPDKNSKTGRKFDKVKITRVLSGTENLPYLVEFTSSDGSTALVRMSQTTGTLATRPFHTIFSLQNPRDRYPGISDEVWTLIQQGKVSMGMTKQECSLALGPAHNVETYHDYSKLIDIWTFDNGLMLRFEDGILVKK